MIIRIQI